MKYVLFNLILLLVYQVVAQEKEKIKDPFRLDYKKVYENMHYDQPLRPQVHYTPITGQIADPTGLIRYKGKYHLFYMFDEWSKSRRDNKGWGHATSDDIIYWEQHPPITNTVIDNAPGSGSGIVDWNNSLGLRQGVERTMVVFYTDYGRGPSLAFSTDAGKTWVRHAKNPLLPIKEGFRDPVVFWYKPDRSWRMVIYEEPGISFYRSDNLTDWSFLSKMDGFYECPDLMQIPVDGNEENKKWVLIDGNGSYYIGEFDGTKFIPESKKQPLSQLAYLNKGEKNTSYSTKDVYATQSWKQSYEGDGPFYQLAFMMIKGAPDHDRTWSQQLIFPVELTLKTINNEVKFCRNPISGIKKLRYDPKFWKDISVKPEDNPLEQIDGDVFEIISEINLGSAKEIVFDIRGEKAVYNIDKQQLVFMESVAKVIPTENKIKIRFIVDRNSIEIYINHGEITFTRLFYPELSNMDLSLTSVGGEFKIDNMEVYRLESIWLKREQELGYKRKSVNYAIPNDKR
ncbi:glycoside hydrolase family 32 protein [Confluentibacter flavum]|nr:glycoside hydrolase family 32 protein [Confluentibacter flavum]